MLVAHATPRYNRAGIEAFGLLPECAKGTRKACWVCEVGRKHWAAMHAVRRHGGRIEDVIVFVLEVPDCQLTAHGNGLFWSAEAIGRECILDVQSFRLLSESEVG